MSDRPMRYMTVIKDDGAIPPNVECINLHDVDYIETINRQVIFHVGDAKYRQINNKSDFDEFLSKEGFDNLDRVNLVNLRKIRKFCENLGRVYFVENPDNSSKFALVARIKYKFVSSLINRIISHNNNTTTEIKTEQAGIKSRLKGLFEHL